MGRQIVQDYDIARPKSRSQLSLDVSVDLHSNLRLGPIWVKSGTEIETGGSFSLNLSANFARCQAKAASFSIAGFQVSMTVSEMHSAPVATASMASSLRTPKTRAVIPSAIRTR